MSTFPPIAEYAFLSDCEVSGLIAPDGSVEWLCLPRPDSPSVFGALARSIGGLLPLRAVQHRRPDQRRYLPGTNGARDDAGTHRRAGSRCSTCCGRARPTDARRERYRRGTGRRRSAGHAAAHRDVLRAAGSRCQLNCMPLFDYGRTSGEWTLRGRRGYDRVTCRSGDLSLDARQQPAPRRHSGPARTAAPRSSTARRRWSRCRGTVTTHDPRRRALAQLAADRGVLA